MRALAGRAGYGLSRELWVVEFGIFLNMLGYGAVLPFEIIYLHDGRGFTLGVAGLVIGTITGVPIVIAPLAGPLIDRLGARAVAACAAVALAAGYAGLAFAHRPAEAFAAAALAGAGNGALNPGQSTLLATMAPPDLRHRAAAVSRVAANAGLGVGGAIGGLVASQGLAGFVSLFVANAVTYLAYLGVLVSVVRETARPERTRSGYRLVARDRAFVKLAGTNVAMIAVGWGVFSWLVPPYARSQAGVGTRLIGLLLLANAATVVLAQVPVARLAEGRRRASMIALAAAIFTAASLLVVAAGLLPALAYPALLVAVVAVGIGECLHTTVLTPLAADLAPAALRGRYMASLSLSWWIGLALAPTLGAELLNVSPASVFASSAAASAATGVLAMTLNRSIPAAARLTPRPGRPGPEPPAAPRPGQAHPEPPAAPRPGQAHPEPPAAPRQCRHIIRCVGTKAANRI